MVTLLHTADTHLGYRQYHRPEREADFSAAFAQVIDAAIEQEVDAVVHAGDLFNSSRPGIEVLSGAFSQLQRLRNADIPFLGIVGNHDGTRDRQWIDVFESLGLATRLDSEGLTVGSESESDSAGLAGSDDGTVEGGGQVALYGLDHVDPGRRDRLEYAFDAAAAEGADAALLVAHGLFEPFPTGDWDVAAICRQSTVAFDAILAGDDHTSREGIVGDGTLITYPGSTERTAADQREPRRFNFVRVPPDGAIDVDSRDLNTREFLYVDVEMDDGNDADRVLAALESEHARENGFEGSVVVVTLTGAGKRVRAGPIEEFGLERGALVVRVNDRREFDDQAQAYDDVAFADPEAAVQQRRRTLGLSELGSDIEELARSTDEVPDSNVTDVVEERVREWIEERPLEAFERRESTADETAEATEAAERTESIVSTETAETTGPTEATGTGSEPAPADDTEPGAAAGTEGRGDGARAQEAPGSQAGTDESADTDRPTAAAAGGVESGVGSAAASKRGEGGVTATVDGDGAGLTTDDTDRETERTDAGDHDAEPRADQRGADRDESDRPADENAGQGADAKPESTADGSADAEEANRTTQSTLWDG